MALIIEDGSVIAGAESFATVAELDTYATKRGVTNDGTETAKEQALRKASDYLFMLEEGLQGWRVDSTQELIYPRTDVVINGFSHDSGDIPNTLKNAQIEMALYELNTGSLQPDGAGKDAKVEEVGSLKVEYFETAGGAVIPLPTKALSYLRPLTNQTSGLSATVIR